MNLAIPWLSFEQVCSTMDEMGKSKKPFVFFVDYKAEAGWIGTSQKAHELGIKYQIGFKKKPLKAKENPLFIKKPISESQYQEKFNLVQKAIKRGDSFLVNLTAPTHIESNLSIEEIFEIAQASYKLLVPNYFTVFSPECFIQIRENKIKSFPMKGTLDASKHASPDLLMNDVKEQAEHATIVDLIRNDISQVAYPIQVEKYKFIDKVKTNEGDLWQMSSLISGELLDEFKGNFGKILRQLLPAGSISGAPKKSTLKIIEDVEAYSRGFYTGIMGMYDGDLFDSGVMIRYIETTAMGMTYKSGGGITIFSDAKKEYQELIQKVYLPF
jgi:para-aminobenzoate synthetase component 1